MLNEQQAQRIHTNGIHTLHDHRFASLIYGEAFLEDDIVVYFDGRVLTVCAYRLSDTATPKRSKIREWVHHWVKRTSAESMILVTPVCPDLRTLGSLGFQKIRTWRAEPITRELIAACAGDTDSAPQSRLWRRAWAAPYQMQARPGGAIDARKLALIERFTRFTGMTQYLAALTLAWPALLSDEKVCFIEAWQDGSLMGFVAIHRAFARGGVAIAMARDPLAHGVTDFLYAHMLTQARALGCEWVNLCSSPTRGQHAYKLKWAMPSPLAAYALIEWTRPSLGRRHHSLWGARIVRLPAPPSR